MRVSTVFHIHRGDVVDVFSGEHSDCVLITGSDGQDVPIYSQTPEQFEALAAAAQECARRMREPQQPRPTLEEELERAG